MAAEFAIVKIRPTRVDQLVKEGSKKALTLKKILDNLDVHLSAAQLGITLTSLGIGGLSEPAIASVLNQVLGGWILSPVILHSISIAIAFMIATFLHITLGEQVPKMWAIETAEKMSLRTAPPLYWFTKITYPIILILKFSTDKILDAIGVQNRSEHETHSEEEIKLILSQSPEIDEEEQQMLERIFNFTDRLVREIMIHRKDMTCLYLTDSIEETLHIVENSNHSRFPVCGEDKDDVVGYINIRDLYNKKTEDIDLQSLLRKVPRIYEATVVPKAMKLLQKEKHQIAMVVDEHGGISGIVTMEDIVEEIVGDIQDEYDEETPDFLETKEGILVDGTLLVDEINEKFGLEIEPIDGVDTISGHILSIIEKEPELGDEIEVGQYVIQIAEIEKHRITRLKFKLHNKKIITETAESSI